MDTVEIPRLPIPLKCCIIFLAHTHFFQYYEFPGWDVLHVLFKICRHVTFGASREFSVPTYNVVGFYGRPWTTDQRRELLRRMEFMKLNTYVYAPKDDLKHRAYWRDKYTPEEAGQSAQNYVD